MRRFVWLLLLCWASSAGAQAAEGSRGPAFFERQRVLESVAEGKAGIARIKRIFDDGQAWLDREGGELKKLETAWEGETDAGKKRELAAEISRRTAAARKRLDETQAQLDRMVKELEASLDARLAAIADDLRRERGFTEVLARKKEKLGDDVTDEVIRRYDARHPAGDGPK